MSWHKRGCPLFTHPTQRGPGHPTECTCDGPWESVTMDDLFPMFGEGTTRTEAMHDLVESLGEVLTDLRENRDRLSEHLADQLAFLERLEWEFQNRAESGNPLDKGRAVMA